MAVLFLQTKHFQEISEGEMLIRTQKLFINFFKYLLYFQISSKGIRNTNYSFHPIYVLYTSNMLHLDIMKFDYELIRALHHFFRPICSLFFLPG